MIRKLKKNVSIFLLLVFILPSIAKLEHHHEHVECKAKHEKHSHECNEKCAICDFEFSVFFSDFNPIFLSIKLTVAEYCNTYRSVFHSTFSKYSFLLRAPPYKQILK